jgi:hypothetical protein
MKFLVSLSICFGISAAHSIVKQIVIDGNVYVSAFSAVYRTLTQYLLVLGIRVTTRAMISIGNRIESNGDSAARAPQEG